MHSLSVCVCPCLSETVSAHTLCMGICDVVIRLKCSVVMWAGEWFVILAMIVLPIVCFQ